MLKAYAVALVLTTSNPVANQAEEGVKAPIEQKPATTQIWRPGSVRI